MNIRSVLLSIGAGVLLPILGAMAAGEKAISGVPPVGGGTVVAGLPDLMATDLGFGINGYTQWGQTTVLDQPALVKATKAGPSQNLCLIGTALYRTFNKGNYAAGHFIDITYRNGTPIYTRHVAALAAKATVEFENRDLLFQEGINVLQVKIDANNEVSESNESNTYEIRVVVKVDCNGDGIITGSTPQIKNPSPPTAPKTPAKPARLGNL